MAAARKPAAAMFSYVEDDDELFTDVQTFEKKTPAVTAKTAATEELTLLGTTALTLVGMKFYAKFRGTYNVGEVLRLERDPINVSATEPFAGLPSWTPYRLSICL